VLLITEQLRALYFTHLWTWRTEGSLMEPRLQ